MEFEWSSARGRLGVMVMGLTPELRSHFGVPADRGVLVARVEPATPAARAGIEVGDVIVGVEGRRVAAASDVLSALADLGKGDHVTVELVRDGTARSIEATLADPPSPAPSWLRRWLESLDSRRAPVWPFDERFWFGSGMLPPWPRPEADSTDVPTWLRRLLGPGHADLTARS